MLRLAFGIQSLLAVLIGWTTIVGMCVEWYAHYQGNQGKAYATRAELAAVLSEAAVPWLLAAIFLALSALFVPPLVVGNQMDRLAVRWRAAAPLA